jgi:hypothetical protein
VSNKQNDRTFRPNNLELSDLHFTAEADIKLAATCRCFNIAVLGARIKCVLTCPLFYICVCVCVCGERSVTKFYNLKR